MFNPNYGYTVLFGIGGVLVIGIGALLLGVVLVTEETVPPRLSVDGGRA